MLSKYVVYDTDGKPYGFGTLSLEEAHVIAKVFSRNNEDGIVKIFYVEDVQNNEIVTLYHGGVCFSKHEPE